MSSEKRSANALGGKTARPCDSCLCKRARWYCAADDAFLCQSCDASVHSANQLARRHERLCLKTSSATGDDASPIRRQPPPPPWLTGFRRKARTPRHHSKPKVSSNNAALVPLLVPDLSCSGDDSSPPDDEQLLYRVPVFDPLADPIQLPIAVSNGDESRRSVAADVVLGFDTCDADLAADMESLLANDLDSETFCMEALGLMDSPGVEWRVKVEEVDELVRHVEGDMDLSCDDTLDLKFGCDSPATDLMGCCDEEEEERERKKICLSLDYEAVITAWASQGSPWMNGDRPNLNPDDCWPDWTGISSCGLEHQQQYDQVGGGIGAGHHQMMMMDRGREARVSRYREKRRSRLFSKKIRYEVRKLNAEKRPRMKGRFVKRASLVNGPHPHPPPPGGVVAAAANFSF